jgi:hypothetical protein
MMRTVLLQGGNALLRTLGIIMSLIHFIGQLMYWDYYRPLAIVPGVVLMVCSVLPLKITVQKRAVLFALVALLVIAYTDSGLPFLQSVHDAPARAMFFLEFLLLCSFVTIGLITQQHNPPGASTS